MEKVQVEEILNRKELEFDSKEFYTKFENKSILITGAAGSIGSELVLKFSKLPIKKLICLDQSELDLFELSQKFKDSKSDNYKFLIANIRDRIRLNTIFEELKPDIIFHTAAYKHVPMMENQIYESIHTNVLGTKIVADLAIKHHVEKMVLISTDKAVNPSSIMGASKRIAELYIKGAQDKYKTSFIIARFGNVIETKGSVIPYFRNRIIQGKPLEVTDKRALRYLMTKEEACQLIFTSGAFGKCGEVFIFDMGSPIFVFQLAKILIQQYGLNYPSDININFIGLRDGEKLEEQLLYDDERCEFTKYERINVIKSKNIFDGIVLETQILNLSEGCKTGIDLEVLKAIQLILPDFKYSGDLAT